MMRPDSLVSRVARKQYPGHAATPRLLAGFALAALSVLATGVAQAQANNPIARFDGGIGVVTAALANGVFVPNNVNDTQPAGRPWVIADLKGQVFGDGSFDVRGKGLLLAGAANVGRTNNASVRLRLYCGFPATPTTPSTLVSFTSAEAVPLEPNGDFRLRGELAVVNQPLNCPNATLLILNAGQSQQAPGGWFAAGIPKQ